MGYVQPCGEPPSIESEMSNVTEKSALPAAQNISLEYWVNHSITPTLQFQ